MKYRYCRAHPNSELGNDFNYARSQGWILIGFQYWDGAEKKAYPVFRESFFRWFKRVIIRRNNTYHRWGD